MNPIDLTGIVEEIPVCPICNLPIEYRETCALATAEGVLFLVHHACSDISFFNA